MADFMRRGLQAQAHELSGAGRQAYDSRVVERTLTFAGDPDAVWERVRDSGGAAGRGALSERFGSIDDNHRALEYSLVEPRSPSAGTVL